MKFVRLFLIGLAALLALGLTLAGLALAPPVQHWAALRAARGIPGLKLELGGISAGLSRVSLRDVTVRQDGLVVRLDQLDASYSLFQLLTAHRLAIGRLSVSGLALDASGQTTGAASSAPSGAPVLAPGLLDRIKLPFALVLDEVDIAGRATLPGKSAVAVDFKLTGGKFAPGQEGLLLLTATLRNQAPNARVAVLNAQVRLRAMQTLVQTLSGIGLTAVVDAAGRSFSDKNRLSIAADLSAGPVGENYRLSVDTLLQGMPENVLTVSAALPAGGKGYAGEWALKVRTAQIEPFFLGGALPDLNASGAGHFTYVSSTQAVSLRGKFDAAAGRLEVVEPALQAMGALTLSAQFDVEYANAIARLHQLDVHLAGAQPVLDLHASSAAELNFRDRRLQLGADGPGDVLQLNLSGLPLAWVRPFVKQADVSGGLITGQISVRAEQDRLIARMVQPLRIGGLTVGQGGQTLLEKADVGIAGDVVLTAGLMSVNASALTLQTPAGDALTAQVRVTVPLTPVPAIAVMASYQADLPRLLANWVPLGHLKSNGEWDFTMTGGRIDLRRFQATVTDGADSVLFKTTALHPFALDLATFKAVGTAAASTDLMQFSLGRIPLAALGLGQPDSQFGGVIELGEFVLASSADGLVLRSAAPFTVGGVSLSSGGIPALKDLRIEAQPSVEFDGLGAVKARTGNVTVRSSTGAALATFQGEATKTEAAGLHGSLTFNFEIPALASQPLFAGAQAVTAGHASGEVRAAWNGTGQVEARVTLNGLVARNGGQTLPVANLSFQAITQPDGKVSLQVPLLLDRAGQRSDLKFAADLAPLHEGFRVEAKLTGDQIEIADAASVLGVFLPAPAEEAPVKPVSASPVPPAKVTPDERSAWSRIAGSLTVDIKSVTKGTEWSMTGLKAHLAVDPQRLSLDRLEAAFGAKGRLTAQGDIRFGKGEMPYQLGASFALADFDAGALVKALEPGRPPTVEGLFNVKGVFTGDGQTVAQTLARTRGSFDLTSRQGIFRGLQRTSNKVSMTSKAVELGASVLGSLFGSQNVTKAAEKVAGSAYFVDQLAQSLGELNYDQFNLKLVRTASLDVSLDEISLVSPELHLVGHGGVTYVAGKPFLEQPFSASLTLAGRDKIGQLFGKLKLLDGTRDELGYDKIREPVTVTGTLAKPDPSAFFTKIAASKLIDWLTP